MNKVFDSLYKYAIWIIVAVSILAYLFFRILDFDGDYHKVLVSVSAWLNLAFVIFLNLTVQEGAINSGISYGLKSDEFKLANDINDKILEECNPQIKSFRYYIKNLNREELEKKRDDYLFSIGDKTVDELNKKELKKYNKLKAITRDITGFNLSLYYTAERGGKIKYGSSFNQAKGKLLRRSKKVINGILFGAMTVNVVLSANNVGAAILSVLVISFGLMLTFVMSFVPPAFKLRYNIPQKVLEKNTLWKSYKNAPEYLKKKPEELPVVVPVETEEEVIEETTEENKTFEISYNNT